MRTPRSLLRLAGALLSLALVASACGGSDSEATPVAADDEASAPAADSGAETAAASISMVTSETFDVADYTGEDTMFWFWAPW